MIPLFTAADNKYLTGALVAIISAISNCDSSESLDIHLIESEVENNQINRFKKSIDPFLGGRHKLTIDKISKNDINRFPIYNKYLNALTYARLLIPRLYPGLDKAIYTDSDIIIQKDLSELFNINLGNNLLAASRDIRKTLGGSEDYKVFQNYKYDYKSPYFAAGFLLLNLRLWREENIFDKCISVIENSGTHFRQEDQTTLNLVAYKRWIRLPPSWNQLVLLSQSKAHFAHRQPVNYHTILQYKPWRFYRDTPCEIIRIFYSYLDMTNWSDNQSGDIQFHCECKELRVFFRRLRKYVENVACFIISTFLRTEIIRRT